MFFFVYLYSKYVTYQFHFRLVKKVLQFIFVLLLWNECWSDRFEKCCLITPNFTLLSAVVIWTGRQACRDFIKKKVLSMQELENTMATHFNTLAWEIPWTATVHGVTKSRTWLSDFTFIFHFHALEKEMATHSSILAWRIPGMGAWWAAVYGIAQSWTQLTWLSSSSMQGLFPFSKLFGNHSII